MDKFALISYLDRAEAQVDQADRLIARHSRVMADLRKRGTRSATAWQLLAIFMHAQTLQMANRDRIRNDLNAELMREAGGRGFSAPASVPATLRQRRPG